MSELHSVAHKMVEKNKGILAADESNPTCGKRFESIDTESTRESRNLYRSILFSSKDIDLRDQKATLSYFRNLMRL